MEESLLTCAFIKKEMDNILENTSIYELFHLDGAGRDVDCISESCGRLSSDDVSILQNCITTIQSVIIEHEYIDKDGFVNLLPRTRVWNPLSSCAKEELSRVLAHVNKIISKLS